MSWSISFTMYLPLCSRHNAFFTCIDRLTKCCRLIPCFVGEGDQSASSVTKLFFDNVLRFFGIPAEVILYGTLGLLLHFGRSCGSCWGQACDEFFLPSSDRWGDREDSRDLGADPALPAILVA